MGTLNARRLEKSDKSSNNVRVGRYLNEEKVQALYTINTMGYDSTWSNNISETKVGYMVPENLKSLEDFLKIPENEDKLTEKEKDKLKAYIDLNKNLSDEEKNTLMKCLNFTFQIDMCMISWKIQ